MLRSRLPPRECVLAERGLGDERGPGGVSAILLRVRRGQSAGDALLGAGHIQPLQVASDEIGTVNLPSRLVVPLRFFVTYSHCQSNIYWLLLLFVVLLIENGIIAIVYAHEKITGELED